CLLNVDFVIKLVLFCYGVSILTDYYYLVTTLSNNFLMQATITTLGGLPAFFRRSANTLIVALRI
ncbi:MAG: hypothetical protein ABL865_00790, partial [Candidatus Nitrotoga sp.]